MNGKPQLEGMEAITENWKPIHGFEGIYSVSDLGRVRRDRASSNARAGQILKPLRSKNGYTRLCLRKGGEGHWRYIHRVVACAFLGNSELREVNHKNGMKADNRLANLEWVSTSDNVRHGFGLGLFPRQTGASNGRSKLSESDVAEIRTMLNRKATKASIARRFRVSQTVIWKISTGRNWRLARGAA